MIVKQAPPIFKSFTWLLILACKVMPAQNFTVSSSWIANPFEQRSFIENKGQFDHLGAPDFNNPAYTGRNIRYAASSGGVDIYFSNTGLIYRHDEIKRIREEGEFEKEEETGLSIKRESKYLELEWEGGNPTTEIIADELQTFYNTYAVQQGEKFVSIKALCYKRITYKNIYPGIDIEYILPETGGIKYSLILHPGADPSLVKLRYKNAKGIEISRNGDVVIRSELGDVTDHAPISFYAQNGTGEAGEAIRSSYMLNKNTISFALNFTNKQLTTHNQQPIIIDPWTTFTAFPFRNVAIDVNYDLAGNVYVSGFPNSGPCVAKFSNAGALLWTYTLGGLGIYLYGDFAVDENTGTSYIVQGGLGGSGTIHKVNTIGNLIGTHINTTNEMNELWRAEYNRCLNKIVIAAGGTGYDNKHAAVIDTTMASLLAPLVRKNIVGAAASTAFYDMCLLTIDPYSSFCYMAVAAPSNYSANPGPYNFLYKCPLPGLTPTTFAVNDGYSFVEIGIRGAGSANGMNGMACGPTFLYTYDGVVLKKWNKTTGVLIAQVNTGGSMFANGGLTADECDNVYAGVGAKAIEYNSSLAQIASYVLPDTCYDLKLGPDNKLYACGKGFVSEILVTGSGPVISTSSTPASACNSCNGTATVTSITCTNISGYSYKWSPGGQTTQTATGLCPGNYTVTLSNCYSIHSATVTVTGGNGTLQLTGSQTDAGCSTLGSASIVSTSGGTGVLTYKWSTGASGVSSITGLSAGTYVVSVTDASGCTAVRPFTITQPLPMNITSQLGTQNVCGAGNTNGSVYVNIGGGAAPYSFSWSNGQTTQIATGLSAGIYTITITDGNGCRISTSVTITTVPAVAFSLTPAPTTCGLSNGSATINVSSGTGTISWSYSPGGLGTGSFGGTSHTLSGLSAGTYTVSITDANKCSKTGVVNIAPSSNAVIATFTYPTVCIGKPVIFTNTGSTGTYSWTIFAPVNVSGTTVNFSYTFLTVGTYNVNHTVTSGGCSTTVTNTITVTTCTGPTVTATGNSVCPGSCASVNSSGAGGTGPYTYSWSNGATTQNINSCPALTTTYTVTIRDTGGNSSTSTAVVTVNPAVTVSVTATNISCNSGTGSITASGSNGTSPYTYSWSNGGTSSQILNLTSQIYTVTVTDNKGCTSISSAAIISPPALSGQFAKGTANCIGCGCKEWVMVTATGGTSPYSYTWSDGYVNRYKNKLCPGTYSVNLTDKNGCSISINLTAP